MTKFEFRHLINLYPGQMSSKEYKIDVAIQLSWKHKILFNIFALQNLEDFCTNLNTICNPENLGIMLRKPDRKKEK